MILCHLIAMKYARSLTGFSISFIMAAMDELDTFSDEFEDIFGYRIYDDTSTIPECDWYPEWSDEWE